MQFRQKAHQRATRRELAITSTTELEVTCKVKLKAEMMFKRAPEIEMESTEMKMVVEEVVLEEAEKKLELGKNTVELLTTKALKTNSRIKAPKIIKATPDTTQRVPTAPTQEFLSAITPSRIDIGPQRTNAASAKNEHTEGVAQEAIPDRGDTHPKGAQGHQMWSSSTAKGDQDPPAYINKAIIID